MPASADKLHAVKADRREASAKAQMPERKVPMAVNVHAASTLRASAVSLHQIKLAIEAEHFTTGSCMVHTCVGVIEAFQPGGNA